MNARELGRLAAIAHLKMAADTTPTTGSTGSSGTGGATSAANFGAKPAASSPTASVTKSVATPRVAPVSTTYTTPAATGSTPAATSSTTVAPNNPTSTATSRIVPMPSTFATPAATGSTPSATGATPAASGSVPAATGGLSGILGGGGGGGLMSPQTLASIISNPALQDVTRPVLGIGGLPLLAGMSSLANNGGRDFGNIMKGAIPMGR